jgi:hypothetical protein
MAHGPSDIPPERNGALGHTVIARQLTGDLWCIGCGYNLRGLSIRERCPECGVPVRATILGVVDPRAHELAPLRRPVLVASGLIAWAAGLWIAVASVGLMRGVEIVRELLGVRWWAGWLPAFGLLGLIGSGLAALTLIRPHDRVGRLDAVRAAGGVAAYIPLALIYYHIYVRLDGRAPSPFLQPGVLAVERSALRLGVFLLVVLLILGLRENTRSLAQRSVVVRTGRVDRQSLTAVLASFAVAAGGDVLHIASSVMRAGMADLVSTVGTVLLAVGSVLVVVGVSNVVLDSWRLWPVIVRPGVGLSDVLEDNEQRARRAGDARGE